MERLYNLKIVRSGDRTELYKYNSFLKVGTECNNKNGRKSEEVTNENKIINKRVNLNRSRNKIIRLCSCNKDLNTFITLTYRDNFQDFKKSKYHLNCFFKQFKDLKYIYVLELQQRGAIHYHLLCNLSIDFKTSNKRRKSQIQKDYEKQFASKYWKHGFVDIRNLKSEGNTNVGKYLSSYMVQGLLNKDLQGVRCFGYSRNLLKPIEEKIIFRGNIIELLKDYKVSYINTYQIRYTDKKGKERINDVSYYDLEKEK